MNLIQRVQDILLKPKETWPVIAQETDDIAAIYKKYLVFLAAIPPVAAFLGIYVLGFGMFGSRMGGFMMSGLMHMIAHYVVSLVLVFGVAFVANELAPSFGGTKDLLSAFKLVAYSMTAGYVGGVFSIIMALSVLSLLASIYGIYLLFLGAPVLMKIPEDKAPGYTAVLVVIVIVASLVLGALTYGSMGMGMRM
ncbi:Yip1 family protein [Piscinibacter terrae]|uniref:DUF1282 domain-containing protein n=1 Tax=Piscinibacter terrae TaxID=2496871 RepID=A0A3N7HPV1_9BURK|nr:Yip1 family protein [Albitalea terrae]RQP24248.1 DUF1282 domain-containing protein [Albitalea terrae]